MVTQVVIVGAGPSGLLLAHYLLRRTQKYQIAIYERRGDPRTVSFSTARTYPLTLIERGRRALRKIEGLEEAVMAQGVAIAHTQFHRPNGKTVVFTRKQPIIAIDRTRLAIALLERLIATSDPQRLQIHFNCECTQVDLTARAIAFQKHSAGGTEAFTVTYDRLIGADGANSTVRSAFLKTARFDFTQKYLDNDYKALFLRRPDANSGIDLQPGSIHSWRLDGGTSFLAVPQLDETVSCVITFPHQDETVTRLATPEAAIAFFAQHFPETATLLTPSEAEAFLARPLSNLVTIRCNRYHQEGRVLLIGDAAHAVSPSLGQGGNAALEDVMLFDSLLDDCDDNWAIALPQFTLRRQPDADALLELSDHAFPLSKWLFLELMIRRRLSKSLHATLPQFFSPFLFDLISETTLPYAEILTAYQGWIAKVKKSNQRFLKHLSSSS
jgi:kynurenine 3-monooxygenase